LTDEDQNQLLHVIEALPQIERSGILSVNISPLDPFVFDYGSAYFDISDQDYNNYLYFGFDNCVLTGLSQYLPTDINITTDDSNGDVNISYYARTGPINVTTNFLLQGKYP